MKKLAWSSPSVIALCLVVLAVADLVIWSSHSYALPYVPDGLALIALGVVGIARRRSLSAPAADPAG